MEFMLYLSFVLASLLLIVIPGPNLLLIISTSVSHGTRRGLQTVLGTSSAMMLQLFIAALGTTWFVESLANGFVWLRWLGVAYLLYLGVIHMRHLLTGPSESVTNVSACGTFSRGFVVSLTNPKTILFFSAFLPQFVAAEGSYFWQMMVLSVTFIVLATGLDSLYAILAGRLKGYFRRKQLYKLQHGLSGTLFIGAGIWLAVTRRN